MNRDRDMEQAFEESKYHVKDILGGKRVIPRDLSSMLAEAQSLAHGKRTGSNSSSSSSSSSSTGGPSTLLRGRGGIVSPSTISSTTLRDTSMGSNINSNILLDDMDVTTFEVTETQIATS